MSDVKLNEEILKSLQAEVSHQSDKWGPENDAKNSKTDWAMHIKRYASNAAGGKPTKEEFRHGMIQVMALAYSAIVADEKKDE